MTFELLASLWLHEPNDETIARAHHELGLPLASAAELAQAYADVFLLNVSPYGTAYTDDYGELNGERAQAVATLFAQAGYAPRELSEVAAPDHMGLCLGFLGYLKESELEIRDWAPICCLAVEREPTAPAFYRALARRTREILFSQSAISNQQSAIPNSQFPITNNSPDEELRLKDILRFFLTPARCGVFLSRARLGQMAKPMGLRLPFGSRWEVAEALFMAAGESGQTLGLLQMLGVEVTAWAQAYRQWAETCPSWQPHAGDWLSRTEIALQTLTQLNTIVTTESV